MAAGKIRLQLKGFDSLLEEIQKAEGNINQVVTDCMQKEIDITKQCLVEECVKSNVPDSITREIKSDPIKWENDRASSAVGWELDAYDPRKPSAGYKAVFLNYGTPKRSKHGKVKARGFILKAKKKAAKLAKKEHEESLNRILGDLKK